uniref:DNA-directed RNA polymerase III subunit RPC3 n=1 Tax=Biomphalaria glabrata TaxID=6526 RepID=A0A2C9LPN6_BIOGL
MSRVNTELCYQIVKEYYGEIVANVASFLIRSKSSSLGVIVQRTCYDSKQVKQALLTLIKQNIVTFSQTKSGSIEYTAKPEAILWILRFPNYIHCAKTLFGDAAELLVEELLLQGQTDLGSAVVKTTNKLNESLRSSGSNAIELRASEVMRTMLRLSETRSNPLSLESEPLSFTEISNAMPKDKILQKNMLDQYLKCLSDNCYNFVTKVGESGGGLYQINYFKAIKAICVSHIETIVLERFGSKALRMFRVLLTDKQVEQKQVEERAMLPPKEAKELLYKMFAENFITLTELSKTPDHAPTRTFYFFNVSLIQVSRMILERCYQAISNMMVRRQKCLSENKRLLDKQDRVEAIIASLDAEGAIEQKEEVEQMVTPSEKAQLKKLVMQPKRWSYQKYSLTKQFSS